AEEPPGRDVLATVEVVRAAVVGLEVEGVAHEALPERGQLEGAFGGRALPEPVDAHGPHHPADDRAENAEQRREHGFDVDSERPVEGLALALDRAFHHFVDAESDHEGILPRFHARQMALGATPVANARRAASELWIRQSVSLFQLNHTKLKMSGLLS